MSLLQPSLPIPIDPTGPIKQAIGDSLKAGTTSVIDGIAKWVFSSLADLTSAVFGFIDKATKPDVTAAWFINGSTGTGPYRAMATVAATLMAVLVFGGILQGVVQADIGGMVRRMVVHLPVAVVGIVGTVVVVQVLIDLTDAISSYLTSSVGTDAGGFITYLGTMAAQSGSPGAPLVILGLLMLVSAIVVFVELLVRSLLIYMIVALCPLAWAALVWPALQGALRKTLELLLAVILSKVVVALALAVGAAAFSSTAMTGASGVGAPSAPGNLTEALGTLAMGAATLAVAAFSPLLIAKLLPFAEGAVVAQGTRGAPMRAAQQAWSMKYQLDVARRFSGRGQMPGAGGMGGGDGGANCSAGVPFPGTRSPGVGGAGMGPAAGAGGGSGAGVGAGAGGVGAGGASAAAGPVAPVVAVGAAGVGAGKKVVDRTGEAAGHQTSGHQSPWAPLHEDPGSVPGAQRPAAERTERFRPPPATPEGQSL